MQQLLEFMRSIDPILLGALGFLCGTLLGNRIAIGRDKRQEFNAAAKTLRAQLILIRDNPTPYGVGPNSADIDFFQHYMWPLHWQKFRAAIERYKNRCEQPTQQDEIGQPSYADPTGVAVAASEILVHLKYR